MDKIIIGVALLLERSSFFRESILPNLIKMADEVWIYKGGEKTQPMLGRPDKEGSIRFRMAPYLSLGDAGKFLAYEMTEEKNFYFFACDDDLVYPLDYAEKMIEWIEFLGRRCVVSLHGSTFSSMPVDSYYKRKRTIPCLGDFPTAQRIIFPGSGACAFHSSTVKIDVKEQFRTRNMADIWLGKLLQDQETPAVVLPHSHDYLAYNSSIKNEDTIWGKENKRDFTQTALVNQLSLHPGLRLFQLDWPEEQQPESFGRLPASNLAPEPPQQEQ